MKVLLTGSSGHLAGALLPKLCVHPEVEKVIGVDIAAPSFSHEKFDPRQLDVRTPALLKLLSECDALIHLAFVVLRGKMDASTMREINVSATQRLFAAAARTGIKRLVHLSSAAIYGAGENLNEDAPFRPLHGFLYAHHKAELEHWFAINQPDTLRLRPHIILGPHGLPLFRQLLTLPFYVSLPDPQPQLQWVHEDDVADAILGSLFAEVVGPFNLATSGSYSFRQLIRQYHRLAIPLPLPLARALLHGAWHLTGWGGEPAWLDGIEHSLTLNCARAQQELHWRPAAGLPYFEP